MEKKNLPGLWSGVLGRKLPPGHMVGFSCRAHAALLLLDGFHKNLHFWISSGASKAEAVDGEDVIQPRNQLLRHFALARVEFYGFGMKWMQNVAGTEFLWDVECRNPRQTLCACRLPSKTTDSDGINSGNSSKVVLLMANDATGSLWMMVETITTAVAPGGSTRVLGVKEIVSRTGRVWETEMFSDVSPGS